MLSLLFHEPKTPQTPFPLLADGSNSGSGSSRQAGRLRGPPRWHSILPRFHFLQSSFLVTVFNPSPRSIQAIGQCGWLLYQVNLHCCFHNTAVWWPSVACAHSHDAMRAWAFAVQPGCQYSEQPLQPLVILLFPKPVFARENYDRFLPHCCKHCYKAEGLSSWNMSTSFSLYLFTPE